MACSVKFFEPITMVSRRGGPQEMAAITASSNRAIGRARFVALNFMAHLNQMDSITIDRAFVRQKVKGENPKPHRAGSKPRPLRRLARVAEAFF